MFFRIIKNEKQELIHDSFVLSRFGLYLFFCDPERGFRKVLRGRDKRTGSEIFGGTEFTGPASTSQGRR
jgi:hypothetical protein